MESGSGKLYIVSTPIGNLKDITYRAIEILENVDLIAAEDTRRTRELLNHYNIKTKITSFNEHTDDKKAMALVDEMINGKSIALVTDAGTPLISDPGVKLTKIAIENNIEITSAPGACAAINAIVLSGLTTRSFVFEGFLPEEKKYREEVLSNLKSETRTMIFYVSPHNFKKDLDSFIMTFGYDRYVSLSREMTKKFEETIRGSLKDLYEYSKNSEVKGELVLVINGITKKELKQENENKWMEISIEDHFKHYIDKGIDEKEAMKNVASDRGIKKKDVYKAIKTKL